MSEAAPTPASRIAEALKLHRTTILQKLATVPAVTIQVNGQDAKGWRFVDLPETMRIELTRIAKERHYRSPEEMLENPSGLWQPPVPLEQLVPADKEKAECRCRAFAETWQRLPMLESGKLLMGEIVAAGQRDYKKEFGHEIHERTWRFLFQRTIDRDRGRKEFGRVELFVDDAARIQKTATAKQRSNPWEPVLGEKMERLAKPGELSTDEEDWVWMTSMRHLENRTEPTVKRLRWDLVEYLFLNLPALWASRDSLRKVVAAQWKAWVGSGGNVRVLRDKRTSDFRKKKTLSREALIQILTPIVTQTKDACFNEGARILLQNGQVPTEAPELTVVRSSKIVWNRNVRNQVTPHAKEILRYHRGFERGDEAYIERWWNLKAGDSYTMDDVTLEVYAFVYNEFGKVVLTRGQFIGLIDEKSWRCLGMVYLPTPSYHAYAIRSLMTRVCMEHGICRKRFYLEKGIFEKARLIKGRPDAPIPHGFDKIEVAFGEFAGVEFDHAQSAQAKVIESFNRIFQRLLAGEPGFAGPDEKNIRYVETRRQIALVESGKESPEKYFYSATQWVERLHQWINIYNSTPIEGRLHQGLSPNEMFEKHSDPEDLLIKLPPDLRYLLAHYNFPVRVDSKGGIRFTIGKQAFRYLGKETGPLIGQRVMAGFDSENPELLTVKDRDGKNAVLIPRMNPVPAYEGGEALARAQKQVAEHNSYHKGLFKVIKASNQARHRAMLDDATVKEQAQMGRDIAAQQEKHETEAKRKKSEGRLFDSLARELGFPGGAADLRPGTTLEDLEEMRAYDRKGSKRSNSKAQP